MSESALKRSVLRKTAEYNKRSGSCIGADAGVCTINGKECLTNVTTMVGEDEGNGELCVIRAVNSLAAAGGKAVSAAVSLTVPENDPEGHAKKMTDEIIKGCKRCGIDLVSGSTVIANEPCLSVTVMGEKKYSLTAPSPDPGRILIMTGYAGNAGAAMLAKKKFTALAERLTAEFIEKAVSGFSEIECFKDAERLAEACNGITAMHDISEGGVFGAIWELLEREKAGCTVNLKDIPIRQAAVEVCEILDVSPYQLRGDGGLLAIVADTPENRMLGKVIGTVDKTADRVVVNGEERRFLEPNRYDGYYEI